MSTAEAVTSPEQGTIEPLTLDFLAYLELERGLSRNTLEAYRSDLLQFGKFLQRRGVSVTAAQHGDLAAFLSELAGTGFAGAAGAAGVDRLARPPAAAATLGRKVACLRSFYRHLRREGLIEHDPTAELHGPRKTQRLPRVLTRDEVARLLREPKGTEPLALRDRALLEVMYACGLRVSEVTGLELSDIDLEEGMLRARGKGSKERLVPVGRHAVGGAERLLRARAARAAGRARGVQAVPQPPRRRPDAPGALQDRPGPRARRGPGGEDEPAHAAPLLRHAPARRRL